MTTKPTQTPASNPDCQIDHDVAVVGGGVAGLSAAMFTARHGLDTLVVDAGESILRRNAHLENFPGFPAGVNARQLLDLLEEQAAEAGCEHTTATVTRVEAADEGFIVETEAGDRYRTEYVVAATKNALGYLEDIDGVGIIDRGKAFVDTDKGGRTGVDGLYAAGRLAEKPHQAAVCAGHGAEIGVTILEDDDRRSTTTGSRPRDTSPTVGATSHLAVKRSTTPSAANARSGPSKRCASASPIPIRTTR